MYILHDVDYLIILSQRKAWKDNYYIFIIGYGHDWIYVVMYSQITNYKSGYTSITSDYKPMRKAWKDNYYIFIIGYGHDWIYVVMYSQIMNDELGYTSITVELWYIFQQ